jgi:hypothetical protein
MNRRDITNNYGNMACLTGTLLKKSDNTTILDWALYGYNSSELAKTT